MRAGICTGVTKIFTFHCDVDWMKRLNIAGIVMGRHIMFAVPADQISSWLFRHELQHAYQQIEHGRFRFYAKYFYYSLRYGLRNNPYEIEAYARQSIPLTESEETALWKLREDSQK